MSGLDPDNGASKLKLTPDTSRRLSELERQENATHFAVRLAGLAAVLAEQLGDPSVSLVTYFSTRNRSATAGLFGFCANQALVVLNCDRRRSFRQFVSIVRDRLRAVQSHGEFPYEILRSELRAWRIRLPDIRVSVSPMIPHPDLAFAGFSLSSMRSGIRNTMPPGFDVKLGRESGGDYCVLLFDAHVYDQNGARALVASYISLLEVVSRDPDLSIDEALKLTRLPEGVSNPN